jgi:hopanoid-associated phosphorylase
VAGGLAPQLSSGSCVVASDVQSEEGSWPTDRGWSERMLSMIPGAVSGALVGVPAPVARPEDKSALHRRTGAVAVDMESHIVARMAAAFNVPFAAIRVITDPAERALPRSALAGMRPDGTTNVGAVLRALARRPADLPALLRTALDARAARAALLRGRQLLGPGLGLADLRELELDVP